MYPCTIIDGGFDLFDFIGILTILSKKIGNVLITINRRSDAE